MSSVAIVTMDKKVVQNLINARKVIKRKFEEFLQSKFKPIIHQEKVNDIEKYLCFQKFWCDLTTIGEAN